MYCYVKCSNCKKRYSFYLGSDYDLHVCVKSMLIHGYERSGLKVQFWSKCRICGYEEQKEVKLTNIRHGNSQTR